MNWKKILKNRDWEDRLKDIEEANKKAKEERDKGPKLGRENIRGEKRVTSIKGRKMTGGGRKRAGKHTTKRRKSRCDMCTRTTSESKLIPTESGLKYCKTCAKSKGLIE